jgi:hypothetical protein
MVMDRKQIVIPIRESGVTWVSQLMKLEETADREVDLDRELCQVQVNQRLAPNRRKSAKQACAVAGLHILCGCAEANRLRTIWWAGYLTGEPKVVACLNNG